LVFKKLRFLDSLSNKDIINSLNSKHSTKISSSEGFSQAMFISTEDNRFILKTLKEQEFENVFDKFLIFFVNYLEKNPDSLLCRIYGIFRIKPSDGSGYLLFILLRNAKGPFKKVINK
jgi:1-phosphatidylinositol-4-phosphate 5-kinase